MTVLIIVMVVIIVATLIYLSTLEGEYEVRRSLLMDVSAQTIFDKVRDFKTWQQWSPWLIHEPETRLSFSDQPDQEGGYYSWDGQRIGAGKITHQRFEAPNRIEQRLEFIRPFKSVADVWWELEEREGQTQVSWCMRGHMPFFMRFMTAMTKQMIAKDYDLGLAMLRGLLDESAERPVIEFHGETEREPQAAIWLPFSGQMEAMVEFMQESFPRFGKHVDDTQSTPTGPPFTAYHEVDLKKMFFRCDLAMPVTEDSDKGDFQYKTFVGGRYFKVTLQGSYDFLESAWYSAMGHIRMLKLKLDKSRPTYEVYENDPNAVSSSNEILTSLFIPLK